MEMCRKFYRHPAAESVIMLTVLFQIGTGLRLIYNRNSKIAAEKIQVYTGLYLSFFLLVHVSAVLSGRYIEKLDTNFYYAAAGLNYFPATFFFIPYYFLAVTAISLHVAAIHYIKTNSIKAAYGIAFAGICTSILIIAGFTDFFHWHNVPGAYQKFIEHYFGKGY